MKPSHDQGTACIIPLTNFNTWLFDSQKPQLLDKKEREATASQSSERDERPRSWEWGRERGVFCRRPSVTGPGDPNSHGGSQVILLHRSGKIRPPAFFWETWQIRGQHDFGCPPCVLSPPGHVASPDGAFTSCSTKKTRRKTSFFF